VYGQWKQSGVKLVGIGLLAKKEACQAFVQRHHLSFPNGYDGDGNVARLYGFTYQPYWAVIDKDGRLIKAGYGPQSEDELVGSIKRLTGR
jgi:peroxiredoxin